MCYVGCMSRSNLSAPRGRDLASHKQLIKENSLPQPVNCARSGVVLFFFFQAEDGIRDVAVTGFQTCALPISHKFSARASPLGQGKSPGREDFPCPRSVPLWRSPAVPATSFSWCDKRTRRTPAPLFPCAGVLVWLAAGRGR